MFTSTTKFHLYRYPNPGTVRGVERRTVITEPACPMFYDLPSEVRELVDQGFRIGGHIDN